MTPVDPVFIWLITRDIFSPSQPYAKVSWILVPKGEKKRKDRKEKSHLCPEQSFHAKLWWVTKDNDREYVWALRVSHKPIFVPA